jgi:hypothetical protein
MRRRHERLIRRATGCSNGDGKDSYGDVWIAIDEKVA